MFEIITFLKLHYDDILAIIGGIVSIATIIVKLTPSTKDDEILNKIINVLSKLSIINTKEDTKIIEEAKEFKEDNK